MEQPVNQFVITHGGGGGGGGSGCKNGRNIKNFENHQPLLDVHRQYLWTFLIDLQAEVSRFRCRIFHCFTYFLKI